MAKKETITGKELDAYYAALTAAKIKAGLPKADAEEVVARQRAEDEANKVSIQVDAPDKPTTTDPKDSKSTARN